jgi:hypothetical protein
MVNCYCPRCLRVGAVTSLRGKPLRGYECPGCGHMGMVKMSGPLTGADERCGRCQKALRQGPRYLAGPGMLCGACMKATEAGVKAPEGS